MKSIEQQLLPTEYNDTPDLESEFSKNSKS